MPSAPSSRARSKAAKVFSGAACRAPRWPSRSGRELGAAQSADRDAVTSTDQLEGDLLSHVPCAVHVLGGKRDAPHEGMPTAAITTANRAQVSIEEVVAPGIIADVDASSVFEAAQNHRVHGT